MAEAKVHLTAGCLAECLAQMTDTQLAQKWVHQLGHERGLCSAVLME